MAFRFLMALWLFGWLAFGLGSSLKAQSQEAQQLLLNVEKLSQLKNILRDVKRGYQVLSGGYNSVRNIAQGNFSLHEVFLDGLMLVSPEVRKYRRVADIVAYQQKMVLEYKAAFKRFKTADVFSMTELGYIDRVYGSLLARSLDNLEELAMVITGSKLRMSDEERLRAIDRIFLEVEDKLLFLRDFNDRTVSLGQLRERQRVDLRSVGSLFGKEDF
jgi:hypothetical protein